MKDLSTLTKKLSKIGVVEVIKDDYVFTLYMVNDTQHLDNAKIPFTVLNTVLEFITDKPNIEIFKNESNFLLLVLKP